MSKGFRERPSVTKKEYAKQLIEKHKAGAVPTTEEETKQIELEQQRQKEKAIWDYLLSMAVFRRQASELADIKLTLDEWGIMQHKTADGIIISKDTLQAKLNEYYFAHKKLAHNLTFQKKMLADVWKVNDEEIEAKHKEWILDGK